MNDTYLTHYFGDGNDDGPDDFSTDPIEVTEEEWSYWSNRWPAAEQLTAEPTVEDLPF